MLRIRLSRVGKKKQPAYRLIVADSRSPRDGAFLKIIGHYNPRSEPATLVVKEEEAVYWLEKGARPSETVAKLLTRIGVMERAGKAPVRYEGKDVAPAPKKEKKEAAPQTEAAAPPAKATAQEAPSEPESPEAAVEEAEAGAEEPEVAAEEPEAAAEAPEAAPEEQAEAEATSAAPETAEEPESEAKEGETETEADATNDEQPQEQAENQE